MTLPDHFRILAMLIHVLLSLMIHPKATHAISYIISGLAVTIFRLVLVKYNFFFFLPRWQFHASSIKSDRGN